MTTEPAIDLIVNGERRRVEAPPEKSLLDVLRDDLDLTGAKKACDDGECGSCFVLLGDKPVMCCKLDAHRAEGKEIVTIEGLTGGGGALHPLQEAFLETGATQCGFCIPGMIMRAEALLRNNPEPGRDDIVKSLSRNLCRCTGYLKIFEAVAYAAELRQGRARSNWSDKERARGIGATVQRKDTPGTVDGSAKYAADLKMDGMLHGRVLRSPHHHARILSIDTSAAAAMPGVEVVVTAADIPGTPAMSNCQPQPYVFPADRTRFLGEGIAAVAAQSEVAANAALEKIVVEYDPLPVILDVEDAMADGSPSLYGSEPNVSPAGELLDGDIDKGFAEADVIVEDTFSTSRREHAAMEPEAALAYVDEDGVLVVKSPLYYPFVQGQQSIANNLALDVDRVRVICPHMGGNFGKRGDALAPTVAGLLTLRTGKPGVGGLRPCRIDLGLVEDAEHAHDLQAGGHPRRSHRRDGGDASPQYGGVGPVPVAGDHQGHGTVCLRIDRVRHVPRHRPVRDPERPCAHPRCRHPTDRARCRCAAPAATTCPSPSNP